MDPFPNVVGKMLSWDELGNTGIPDAYLSSVCIDFVDQDLRYQTVHHAAKDGDTVIYFQHKKGTETFEPEKFEAARARFAANLAATGVFTPTPRGEIGHDGRVAYDLLRIEEPITHSSVVRTKPAYEKYDSAAGIPLVLYSSLPTAFIEDSPIKNKLHPLPQF